MEVIEALDKNNKLYEGNQDFVIDFYERYKAFMLYVARKYTTDQSDCEDIVHDTMIKLMSNMATLCRLSQNKTATYISMTIRSVYLDRAKSGMKKEHPVSDESLEILKNEREPEQDIEFDYSAKWDAEILKSSLSGKDWYLLKAKYILGHSDDDISRELKCSPDSVRTLLRRARQRAKNILSEEW